MTDAEKYAADWAAYRDAVQAISLEPDNRDDVIQAVCDARGVERSRLGCLPPYFGMTREGIEWAVGLAIDRVLAEDIIMNEGTGPRVKGDLLDVVQEYEQ